MASETLQQESSHRPQGNLPSASSGPSEYPAFSMRSDSNRQAGLSSPVSPERRAAHSGAPSVRLRVSGQSFSYPMERSFADRSRASSNHDRHKSPGHWVSNSFFSTLHLFGILSPQRVRSLPPRRQASRHPSHSGSCPDHNSQEAPCPHSP